MATTYQDALDCVAQLPITDIVRLTEHLTSQRSYVRIPYNVAGAEWIQYYVPGLLPMQRGQTLLSKEPETIAWIDRFEPGSRLWDIGANVGIYTLYAALTKQCEVMAFEPLAQNYLILNKNISLNQIDDRVTALNIALCEEKEINRFNLRSTVDGSSLHAFGQTRQWDGQEFSPVFRQGMLGLSIDELRAEFHLPCPHYIKVDVDSIEHAILRGGRETLADPEMRGLLVELDSAVEDYEEVIAMLDSCGLSLATTHADQSQRPDGSLHGNFIFERVAMAVGS